MTALPARLYLETTGFAATTTLLELPALRDSVWPLRLVGTYDHG